ncbi:ABC transporter permease [Clostridium oryzae]|uniref:ABC-2 family transporter protein n=1 Tax=Clostridium oryzae TaxID=1450648 RepID=A0A1V4IVQ9_9CLOT|nr:ABC transporter permease [Clostridium oryzae]OPJ64138.1 ABC-2 family transporter protein [Clostridium oryzae]
MRTVFIIFKTSFKRIINNRSKFLINLLLPVLAIVLAIAANYIGKPTVNLAVVTKNKFPEQQRIVRLLEKTKGINVRLTDSKLIKTDVILGKYTGVITFKKSFTRGQINNINKYFDFYTVNDKKINSVMKGIVTRYLSSDRTTDMTYIIKNMQKSSLSKTARVMAFLVMALFITCTVNGSLMLEDKSQNTFIRFKYSPNLNTQYILGNILYNYVFTYVQFFLSFSILYMLDIKLSLSFGTLLSYGALIVLLSTAFGTLVTCIFERDMYASMFSSAVSMILCLLGGSFITYSKMPRGLKLVSEFTPIRWVIRACDYTGKGTSANINPLVVLLTFSVIFSIGAIAISKYRKFKFQ